MYNVRVYKEPRITELKFSKDQNTGANFPSSIEEYIGTVNEENNTITVTVANQVNISSLNASISGDNISSLITYPLNFTGSTSPYSQTITIKNQYLKPYVKNYTVIVTLLSKDFVSKWKVGSNKKLKLPIDYDGTYDFTVDWGDGKSERITSWTNNTHTYEKEGEYTVTITGQIEGFNFEKMSENDGGITIQLISISSWGNLKFGSDQGGYFKSCSELKSLPSETPNLEGITNMSSMFSNATSFNSDISNWDVSKVTNMSGMFLGATSFNSDISSWDISKVTDMSGMFSNATSFNQDLTSWNTFNVTNMSRMFSNATSFNGYLNNFEVYNVTDMASMFNEATSFNKSLSNWQVGNVTDMTNMFGGAIKFNQDISQWEIHTRNKMTSMFSGATSMTEEYKPQKN
ncbi:BspA family leucine-rich repeat surface protein [Ichthyobacterium seriolicida]|uniref:BspA family leucine-rich repeat surface protein n=1 Tax=Ichthyobacterium seriolicida TaxID=242600 RepID=UPI000BBB9A28|nr:BspA family leucine-rich repeat surface protein [Ichthyobacterium seriolicida]